MQINEMNLEEVNARLAEINSEVETRSGEELDALEVETRELMEHKANLEALETRNAQAKALEENEVRADKKIETSIILEERKMDIKELRNSQEYVNAYAEYIKTGEEAEVRSLLTDTTGINGTIAVPDFVYDAVKTAWDKNDIMSLVTKVELPGNLKVNFEISGTDAVVHTEGSGAVDEEELIEGIVTIIPRSIKKWVSISDEVMDMRGEAFLTYIYNELTHKIVKKMADQLVGIIASLPQVANATTPDAAKIASAPAAGTVAKGIANLSDEASNPVIIMNKLTWSNFKTVQYANNYGVDPFEGLTVLFNSTLPSYDAASTGDVYMIVGDLGQGAIANFPNGEGIEFKFDALSRKKEDLVEVLGREYVGVGVVASKAFALISKPATE